MGPSIPRGLVNGRRRQGREPERQRCEEDLVTTASLEGGGRGPRLRKAGQEGQGIAFSLGPSRKNASLLKP